MSKLLKELMEKRADRISPVDESLRKDIAAMSAKFPEGSKVRMKHDGKVAKVVSVGKDFVKVAVGNKTMDHKPSELELVEASPTDHFRAKNVAKAVQGLNDLGNKLKGRDAKEVKRIEALFRSGNKKGLQGAVKVLNTDIRSQIMDILEPLGFANNGFIESVNEGITLKQLKQKFKNDIAKYEKDGYFKSKKADQAFMDYAMDNGEVQTSDPDEFEKFMDREVLEQAADEARFINMRKITTVIDPKTKKKEKILKTDLEKYIKKGYLQVEYKGYPLPEDDGTAVKEVSSKTLANYIKKAGKDSDVQLNRAKKARGSAEYGKAKDASRRWSSRRIGKELATNKLVNKNADDGVERKRIKRSPSYNKEDVNFFVRMDNMKAPESKKVGAILQKAEKSGTIKYDDENEKGVSFYAKSKSDVDTLAKNIAKVSRVADVQVMEAIDMSKAGKYTEVMDPKTRKIKKVLKTDLKKYVDKGWTHMVPLKNRLTKEVAEKKYTKPTKAEIAADKKKDRAGKAKPSISNKSLKKSIYKEEALEEKLEVSDGLDQWIKDFQSSDAPQFADQSKEEIRNMAIAAYLAAKKRAKGAKGDDVEESSKAYGKSAEKDKKANISSKDKKTLSKLSDLLSFEKGNKEK